MEIIWEIIQEEVSVKKVLWWEDQGFIWTQAGTTHHRWVYQQISRVDEVCALHKGWKGKDEMIY